MTGGMTFSDCGVAAGEDHVGFGLGDLGGGRRSIGFGGEFRDVNSIRATARS